MNKFTLLIILAIQSCAMNPHMELGLGGSAHDNYGWTTDPVGFIGVGVAPFDDLPSFRIQAKHLSDPTTFNDAGITWIEGAVRFGGD